MDFNEWIIHIYRELGYNESTLKQHEQSIRDSKNLSSNQHRVDVPRDGAIFNGKKEVVGLPDQG